MKYFLKFGTANKWYIRRRLPLFIVLMFLLLTILALVFYVLFDSLFWQYLEFSDVIVICSLIMGSGLIYVALFMIYKIKDGRMPFGDVTISKTGENIYRFDYRDRRNNLNALDIHVNEIKYYKDFFVLIDKYSKGVIVPNECKAYFFGPDGLKLPKDN